MSALRALAPAKVNLGLFVGPVRDPDARHELVTVMQSISLADELTLGPEPDLPRDQIVCAGVPGDPEDNLAARALRAFRERTGWDAPPQRLGIEKRIPIAAGLAGGSADAAATLRLAARASGLGDHDLLLEIAAGLGADVPAQVAPGRWLALGAGERLRALPDPRPALGILVLPLAAELSTAAVYREADEGSLRSRAQLAELAEELGGALAHGRPLPLASELLHNDLQRPAVSLCPEIAGALEEARRAGADPALVSGSGPTVIGLFAPQGHLPDLGAGTAAGAVQALAERIPAAIAARAVDASFGEPAAIER